MSVTGPQQDFDQVEQQPADRIMQWCAAATRPIAFIGVIGMLIVSGVTMVDVLLRWLFSSGISALNEIVAMIFAVTITACLPYGVVHGINLKLDLLANWIVGRLATRVEVVGNLILLLFLGVLTWRLSNYAGDLASRGRTTVVLGWPQAPFMYGVTCLLAISFIAQGLMSVGVIRRAIMYRPSPGSPESSTTISIIVTAILGSTAAILICGIVAFDTVRIYAADHSGITVAIVFTLIWLLLLVLIPLSAAMGLLGLAGAALFIGYPPAVSAFASEVAGFLTNSQVAVLPLFLMMGSFAAVAGMADDVFALSHALLSRFRGGLAMAAIGGCAGFGAVTGSTVATAATIGRVALPEMRARGYSPALATGCVAAGGTLGNLVPPGSAPLVLFALLTEASIGQLFVASVIPSLLVIVAYLLTVIIYVRLSPGSAPPAQVAARGELLKALLRCGPLGVLVGVVLGGLYAGVFTSTEAAAVGAFGAFLAAVLRGRLRLTGFWSVMAETTRTTALVYPLIFGALIFGFFVDLSGLAQSAMSAVGGLGLSPLALVALLLITFLILGTFMDSYTVLIITIPIVTPLVTGVGYDLVWWGVLNLFVVEIGGISPPFGLTMYVLKSIDNVPISEIFKGVTPFCIAAVLVTAILTVFPDITLWLPSTMK